MPIFRRNNYNVDRGNASGSLATLLRQFGGIGGANAKVEQASRNAAERAERHKVPSILTRIYAPTTLDIAPTPYEAGNFKAASMVERIYETVKKEGK